MHCVYMVKVYADCPWFFYLKLWPVLQDTPSVSVSQSEGYIKMSPQSPQPGSRQQTQIALGKRCCLLGYAAPRRGPPHSGMCSPPTAKLGLCTSRFDVDLVGPCWAYLGCWTQIGRSGPCWVSVWPVRRMLPYDGWNPAGQPEASISGHPLNPFNEHLT